MNENLYIKNESAGNKKINEYINRIKAGEDKNAIFEGLPNSFKSSIEEGLKVPAGGENIDDEIGIPPQYKGLNSETLSFIWTSPIYINEEKNIRFNNLKSKIINQLRERELQEARKIEANDSDKINLTKVREELGVNNLIPSEVPVDDIERRKKLSGWRASYELAIIANQQGLDLSKISREEYAEFAIKNLLAIDDSQLRMAPYQRMATLVNEVISSSKERQAKINKDIDLSFALFSEEIQRRAGEADRFLFDNIKIRQGTKDSNSWLYFGINNVIGNSQGETYKSYISVKDLNSLTPERFKNLMIALRDEGYNGDIKIFQDLASQGIKLNDQIVMHGSSEEDAKLALKIAEKFFGDDIDQKSFGKDQVIDGVNKSYSEILAEKIKNSINNHTP